jgi:hypothetical protein
VDGEAALDQFLEGGVLIYIDLGTNAGWIRLEPMLFHEDPRDCGVAG